MLSSHLYEDTMAKYSLVEPVKDLLQIIIQEAQSCTLHPTTKSIMYGQIPKLAKKSDRQY